MKRTFPRPLGTLALGALTVLAVSSGLANAEPPDQVAQSTEVPGSTPPPAGSSGPVTGLPQSPPVLPSPELPPGSDSAVPGTANSYVMDAGSLIGAGGAGTAGMDQGPDAGALPGTGGAGTPSTGATPDSTLDGGMSP